MDEEGAQWLPFMTNRMRNDGLPKPFYTPKRLASKVPADRLRNMQAQILGEIEKQVKTLRDKRGGAVVNKSTELKTALERGLELQEFIRQGDEGRREDLAGWQRDIKAKLPAGSTFKGRAFAYAYTDAIRIRKHLLSTVDYANIEGGQLEFALAVRAFAYYGGICSVWVYFGIISLKGGDFSGDGSKASGGGGGAYARSSSTRAGAP